MIGRYPETYYFKAKGPVRVINLLNPFWYFGNRDDPAYPIPDDGSPVKNDWFHPSWPQWLRVIGWGIRNPLCNFRRYVIGFWALQHIWGPERWKNNPPNWNGSDTMWPLQGEKWCIYLPYISWRIGGFTGLLGWKPNGEFGGPSFKRG